MRMFGLFVLLVGALSMFASACQDSANPNACVNGINDAFARVVTAQREDIARCIEIGTAIEACVAGDEEGNVASAQAETLATESSACGTTPAFGYSSGATTNAEASAAVIDLTHDLFGPDLDATVATGDAGDCQKAVVTLVGGCTDAFIDDYNSCAKAALEAGATEETALVQCKGSDDNGTVAQACQTPIEDGIAEHCAGQDLDVLVPGCADVDLVDCLAAKAVGEPSQAINASAAICEPIDVGLPPAPDPEPVLLETIPLPVEILEISGSDYLSDDETIIAQIFTTFGGADPTDRHVATFKEDGTEFDCITCGATAMRGRNVRVLDAQRAITRRDILECSPSLLDCQSYVLVPIVYPIVPGATINQPLALWESPDGKHVGWTHFTLAPVASVNLLGELIRCTDATEGVLSGCDPANDGDRYEMEDIELIGGDVRTINGPSNDLQVTVTASSGEFKGFYDGGRSMVYFVPFEDGNWDLIKVDVATGEIKRLTQHVSTDEVSIESPDGEWFVVSSTRPIERMVAFAELRRPPLGSIATAAGIQALRLELVDRPCCNNHDRFWHNIMIDRHGDRGFNNNGTGYIGQDLSNAPENFNEWAPEQGMSWKSDSTAFIWIEQRRHALGGGRRLQRATFTSRAPTTPLTPLTPEATWAQTFDQPGGPQYPPTYEASGRVNGQVSGFATLSYTNAEGATLPSNGFVTVEYSNYSDDGRVFLNGAEEMVADLFGPNGTSWDADLKGHGCRQQSLKTSNMELHAPFGLMTVPVFKGLAQSVNEGSVIEVDLEDGLPTGEPGVLD